MYLQRTGLHWSYSSGTTTIIAADADGPNIPRTTSPMPVPSVIAAANRTRRVAKTARLAQVKPSNANDCIGGDECKRVSTELSSSINATQVASASRLRDMQTYQSLRINAFQENK